MSNLHQRILTATLLISLLMGILWYHNESVMITVGLSILGICAWEWSNLAFISNWIVKIGYVLGILGIAYWMNVTHWVLYPWTGLLSWGAAVGWLILQPKPVKRLNPEEGWIVALLGIWILPTFTTALQALYNQNGWLMVIFLFSLIAAYDSGAYFLGKAWGKTTLVSHISPRKTWVGLVGGVLSAVSVAALLAYCRDERIGKWCLIGALVAALSTIGDLFESLLKRLRGVKDSGNLLPGHGGVLDRLDSALACAPFFSWLLMKF